MTNMLIFRTAVALMLWLACQSLSAASLTSSVDRTSIGNAETLQLSVRFDQQTSEEPDFSPLEHHFEIISRSQQSKFSIVNGSTSSYTEWLLQLLPKKTGKLLIPSLRLKGEVSDAIEINVAKQQVSSSGHAQLPVFIETLVDKDEVFVQAQLLLTLRIKHSVSLDGISSEELVIDNANIVKVGEADFYQTINGVKHRVIELKFAIFPENSGTLTIPGVRFDVTLPDRNSRFSGSFFNRGGKLVVLRSDPKTIKVNPRPQNSGSDDWLPSRGISISEKWSRPLDDLVAGEPVTRTLIVTAQGLAAAQLPPLPEPQGDGFKVYPDQPQLTDDVDSQGIIGSRSESTAIVPTREGSIALPPVTLEWWDTVNNRLQTTVLESRTLQVQANTELAQAPQQIVPPVPTRHEVPATESQNHSNWLWLSLLLNLLLSCAFAVALIKLRQRSVAPPQASMISSAANVSEKELFKAVKKAARHGKPDIFRENILKWARHHWQRSDLVTLQHLLAYSEDSELKAGFDRLDQSLYSNGKEIAVDLVNLTQRLETLRQNSAKKSTSGDANELKPLYENK
ncbi:MAG: protein BatD [Pseudomonadales bacterium]|nr:protein BatD [Pseudomonadales bacterium]MCP5171433.1 protein BatD [Pseudomonadales bacterium]